MIVYRITNTVNGKTYIGITVKKLRRRFTDHCARAKNGTTRLARAIRKYGATAFIVETIATAGSHEELKAMEVQLIALHRSNVEDHGYNITKGGDGALGWVPSAETRAKIRAASIAAMTDRTRRDHLSRLATIQMSAPEARLLLSIANKGRKHTEETRRKVSLAGLGRIKSEAERKKIAAALRGKVRPPEVRAKISAAKLGRKMSANARAAMSAASKGKPKSAAHREAMRAAWVARRQKYGKPTFGRAT